MGVTGKFWVMIFLDVGSDLIIFFAMLHYNYLCLQYICIMGFHVNRGSCAYLSVLGQMVKLCGASVLSSHARLWWSECIWTNSVGPASAISHNKPTKNPIFVFTWRIFGNNAIDPSSVSSLSLITYTVSNGAEFIMYLLSFIYYCSASVITQWSNCGS